MTTWTKPASFAGQFYPGTPDRLNLRLEEFDRVIEESEEPTGGDVVGVLSPHAGYVYSGLTAARSFHYAREADPETVVVLGLCHRLPLKGISILQATSCETPLGTIGCDQQFADLLSERCGFVSFNQEAHLSEHSVETQLPFVKRTFPEAKVVEILTQDDSRKLTESVGDAIAKTAQELDRRVLIVSSTDLSHYPPAAIAEEVDNQALEALTTLDPVKGSARVGQLEAEERPGFHCAVCSKAAVFTGMHAAIGLGADHGVLLGYMNSGMAPGGDTSRVVGYGAVAWEKG